MSSPTAQTQATPGPIASLRVVGQLIATPFCGQLLDDLGVDLIKIEQPGTGDAMRN